MGQSTTGQVSDDGTLYYDAVASNCNLVVLVLFDLFLSVARLVSAARGAREKHELENASQTLMPHL